MLIVDNEHGCHDDNQSARARDGASTSAGASLSADRSPTIPMSVEASEHCSLAENGRKIGEFVAVSPAISLNSALIAEWHSLFFEPS
jgi:hypothetical protein